MNELETPSETLERERRDGEEAVADARMNFLVELDEALKAATFHLDDAVIDAKYHELSRRWIEKAVEQIRFARRAVRDRLAKEPRLIAWSGERIVTASGSQRG